MQEKSGSIVHKLTIIINIHFYIMTDSILAPAYLLFISAWFMILVLFWPLLSDLGMQTLLEITQVKQ